MYCAISHHDSYICFRVVGEYSLVGKYRLGDDKHKHDAKSQSLLVKSMGNGEWRRKFI